MAPLYSMTAFSRHAGHDPSGVAFVWEVRSVNHRYLELSSRLPESLTSLEPVLRERIRAKGLQRGKLDVILRMEKPTLSASHAIQTPVLESLLTAVKTITQQTTCAPLNPLEILSWPGVLNITAGDTDMLSRSVLQAFDDTLINLAQMRQREGERLAALILERVAHITEEIQAIKQRSIDVMARQRQKLTDYFIDLQHALDPQRLEQEMVLFTQRMDITEEIDRLTIHLSEVQNLLAQGGSQGRRLDFLMQELHREANTIGSKASDALISRHVVEIKVFIEQMREQIQNIE